GNVCQRNEFYSPDDHSPDCPVHGEGQGWRSTIQLLLNFTQGSSETEPVLRLRLLHGFDAARADGGMLGRGTDVRFPMPAAFAFDAVGFGNNHGGFFAG